MTMVSFEAGLRNMFLIVEMTRDDGPVNVVDATAALCIMFEALKRDAQEGFGDTGTGAEYRFAKTDGPALAENVRLRVEKCDMREERDQTLTILDTAKEVIGEVRGLCKAGDDEETVIAVRRALRERDDEIARLSTSLKWSRDMLSMP